MSKYRRMVFTSIRESCKSKLPAGGNATWMQGSVKVTGGEVYALPAKTPHPPSFVGHPLPGGEGVYSRACGSHQNRPLPWGEGGPSADG
jgi:hypothetical protein